ncbi:MAG TPA: FAD-dependent oxidoreductase, partial [Ramlibacter sp.]|nr:FAD-dependent oxidoreductase [Ramlibacter sp.]
MTPHEQRRLAGPARRLSRGYAQLRESARNGTVYDVFVVGSGYGGAMAAYELAGLRDAGGRPVSVCVLERGREYAPGMFPSSLQEVPPHVRIHRTGPDKTIGRRDALLDVRMGGDVTAIVGNGLGGGSLINAGVMEEPRLGADDLARARLPEAVVADLDARFFRRLRKDLGACDPDDPGHPAHGKGGLRKTAALRDIAGRGNNAFRLASLTVQTTSAREDLPPCTLCGDCMTGCNVGAKLSLDKTLLEKARERGAEIYTGGSVLTVRRDAAGTWEVETVFTDDGLRKRHAPVTVKARKVILAAGTLGSTEILLRSSDGLRLSRRLGEGFSCNGDNLVAVHDLPQSVGTSAEESQPLDRRDVGPTITGMIDLGGLLLQEFAVPAPFRRIFDETVTTTHLLHQLTRKPERTASRDRQGLDSAAVDPAAMDRTLLVGLIGHDESRGRVLLPRRRRRADTREQEGRVRVKWAEVRRSPVMQRDYQAAVAALGHAAQGASVLPNPLWQPLPPAMDFLVGNERGPVLTVHPLGGCAMGATHADGVVDHLGRVFEPPAMGSTAAAGLHEGLMVLDGSVLPGSLGANPALTIAAIARRACRKLAAEWGWTRGRVRFVGPPAPRPLYRPLAACTPASPAATEVELVERLAGPVGAHWVELTLCYRRTPLRDLSDRSTRRLDLFPAKSFLRVFDDPARDARHRLMTLREDERNRQALFIARLEGGLTLREGPAPDGSWQSWGKAAAAWFANRGHREIWDLLGDALRLDFTRIRHAGGFFQSAVRASQSRIFDYALVVGEALQGAGTEPGRRLPRGQVLHGRKELTYARRCNPWLQLTRMKLSGFPGVADGSELALDGRFLARQGIPLLRITRQENQVLALAEFASLALCWMRILLDIHLWSFRAPDAQLAREPQLLPRPMKGVPVFESGVIPLLARPRLPLVHLRWTRYPRPGGQPVVLVHGYSASGTTFTHDAIPMPLARFLWNRGHDVWVLDLRTSAGLETAREAWNFEDVAYADLPVAVDFIARHTGRPVDVFAHCIGAVMLSMGLLGTPPAARPGEPARVFPRQLQALRGNVRRIVLSQKGPVLVYCDDNVLRAYFMRVLRRAILPDD